jgi:hypothetical protein
MPLTKKGKKIKSAMTEQYGKEKGEQVFYASQNKGTIKGTEKKPKKKGGLMNWVCRSTTAPRNEFEPIGGFEWEFAPPFALLIDDEFRHGRYRLGAKPDIVCPVAGRLDFSDFDGDFSLVCPLAIGKMKNGFLEISFSLVLFGYFFRDTAGVFHDSHDRPGH